MYAALFRALPGPLWLRIIQLLLLIAFAILLLMNYVFPWANQYSPWTDSTVGLRLIHVLSDRSILP